MNIAVCPECGKEVKENGFFAGDEHGGDCISWFECDNCKIQIDDKDIKWIDNGQREVK